MDSKEKGKIEKMAVAQGLKDFRWLDPRTVILGHWVRMKCNYGCPGYGKKRTCPPQVPSVEECQEFFKEYKHGILFHFTKKFKDPKMRPPWSRKVNERMLGLEREVFLSGYPKAFMFPQAPCALCKECKGTEGECLQPKLARPTLEAFGVDVFSTARMMGYPIQVLEDYQEEMNRYGMLLVE
jgi:predicted metal-binding protein